MTLGPKYISKLNTVEQLCHHGTIMIRQRHENTETLLLPDHPPELECTCAPLVLGMASPAWAVTELAGFKDLDGKPCERRARLGTKVLFNFAAGNTFKLELQGRRI